MSSEYHFPSPHNFAQATFSSLYYVYSTMVKSLGAERHRSKSNSEFQISRETGFLPPAPLERLPPAFELWERALADANDTLSLGEDDSEEAVSRREASEQWRQRLREGPVISTQSLHDDVRKLQRAHLVLAFLVHFYVHSIPPTTPKSPVVVPKTLAVPLVQVSRLLGIAPILTYADTVLWNMVPINPNLPLDLGNIRFAHTFSETDDENQFYVSSAGVEIRGTELLQIIEEYNALPNVTDVTAISKINKDLTRAASIIDELNDIVQSVRAGCDPHVFYWQIRPWYRGSDADGPSSPGWIYEGVPDSERLDLSGPSAGQSTVFHAIDVWLDIDHKLRQKRYPPPSEENKRADHGFMERMRRYMPGPHREFLEYVEESPRPIRQVALQTPAIRDAYNTAVTALRRFRDHHIRIACLYIVSMSKTSPIKGCPMSAMIEKARREQEESLKRGPIRGTGGNELTILLKAGRDATKRALIQ